MITIQKMELKLCGCFKCIDYDLLNNVTEKRQIWFNPKNQN